MLLSFKDPPMFVHTGGGGKGIRPNQHSQQQQAQQQQHHHQTHHTTHHQSQQQQQQQHQQHHTNQTSSAGNSHPHQHQQQQQQTISQHQQQFQHHPVPLTFFSYPLSQLHQTAATSQHQHPGQSSGNNVGAPQMAPSPPNHAGGNGSPGNVMVGGSGVNNSTIVNTANNNGNNMGGNRQGNNSNTMPHYSTGSALMQATLPPPTNNPFMTSAYHMQLQQQNAVMVAAQYNSVAAAAAAAAGQHGNLGGGQAGHALYQTPQQAQPPQTHQQAAALHSGQTTVHYFQNAAVNAAHAPTQLQHPQQHHQIRNMITAVTHPRQQYLVSPGNYFTLSHATLPPPTRASLHTNAHQQSAAGAAAAGGGGPSAVHVATQLQNTAARGPITGPTTYVPPPFCTPPLQMGAGATLAPQTPMLAAAASMGPPPLQATYGHMSGVPTASASSTSLNIHSPVGGVGGMGSGTPSSTGTEHHKGTKLRKHAIPIIHPITMETVKFDEPQKKSTAVEVKPPPPPPVTLEEDKSQTESIQMDVTDTENISIKMENDKSITVSVASAPPPDPLIRTPTAPVASPNIKEKIDQQMQTDAIKDKQSTFVTNDTITSIPADASTATTPEPSDTHSVHQSPESLQTCVEDPDDTDADTNEIELDNDDDIVNDISLELRTNSLVSSSMDRELTANLNINEENIITEDIEFHQGDSDTDISTETEVKSTSHKDDDCKIPEAIITDEGLQPKESSIQKPENIPVVEQMSTQTSKESTFEDVQQKDVYTTKRNEIKPKHLFAMTMRIKEHEPQHQASSSSVSVTITNDQKNITTTSVNATTTATKNRDNLKSLKNSSAVVNISSSSNNSGNIKNAKQNSTNSSQKPMHHQQTTNTGGGGGGGYSTINKTTNQQNSLTQSAGNNNSNTNNNSSSSNAFITVGGRKNRKLAKRTKENQKKLQHQQQQQQQHHQHHHHQQQQQQQKLLQEPPSSTTSYNQRNNSTTSNNNNSNTNNNINKNSNNNSKNLSSASTNAATNILLTDINNANSSSISSSISGNLREQNKHHPQQQQQQQPQQQHQTTKSNNNNSSRNIGGPSKSGDAKIEPENLQRKHTKTQEIVNQYLKPTISSGENVELTTDEQQLQFLNSSSSACEDEEEQLRLLKEQEQLDHEDLDAINIHFGDFKEDETLIDSKTTTFTAKSSQNKQKNSTTDTVDCSSNTAHSRGGVVAATTHSKTNKGHHNVTNAGAVQKHKGTKHQLIRYSLDELKNIAKSPESRKTPFVPCQKGDCISQLFVSRQQHQHHLQHHGGGGGSSSGGGVPINLHLPAQYQHMNFNESMEFVTGKRRGGQTRKQHHDHQNAAANASNINIAGIAMQSGSSATGSSAAVGGSAGSRKMEVIRIHLSLNEEIKLSECKNAWQPQPLRSKSNNTSPTTGPNDDIEVVLKKVRGILNKLTPDNFDVLLKTMTNISMNTQEKMQQVMLLIFEKTVSEPNFAATYAKFCKTLFKEIKPESKKMFHDSLIKRIQTEFEVNVNDAHAKKQKLQPLVDKMEATTDAKERNELRSEIEDQEYQFRRRAWGTVRFIGEMYKLQSLTSERVLMCIESLLDHGSEEKLEYMCKLLTTVGHLLEAGGVVGADNNLRMNEIFRKINEIVNEAMGGTNTKSNKGGGRGSSTKNKISSRVRFMLQDLMDLRCRNWDQVTPAVAPGSQTAAISQTQSQQQQQQTQPQQHHRRRQQDDKNNQSASGNYERGSQRMGGGGGGGYASNNQRNSRLMMPDMRDSGGVTSSGGNYFMQKPQKSQFQTQQEQQSIDLKKLNFSHGDDTSQTTTKLGNSSAYLWRMPGRQQSLTTNTTTTSSSSFGINSSQQQQQYISGKNQGGGGGGGGSNSTNTRNSFKRQTSNKFQVLSSAHDTDSSQSNNLSSQTSVSSNSGGGSNASDDDDKSITYSSKDQQKIFNDLIEEFLDCLPSHSDAWQAEVLTSWQAIPQKQQICLIYFLLMDYLHLSAVKELHRNACATIFTYLLRCGAFEKKTFARAYEQFAEVFPDLLVDVPNGCTYVFEFLGPILHERLLNFNDVWMSSWRDDRQFTERFVNAFVVYFTKEFGANYIRDLWHKDYKLDRGQLFMKDQQQWRDFINIHKLQFLYDPNTKPQTELNKCSSVSSQTSSSMVEQQVKRLEIILKTANDCDLAIDYINTNVNINNNFLRNLTEFLCCDYATMVITTSSSSTGTTTTISSSNSSTCSNSSSYKNSKKGSNGGGSGSGGGGGSDIPINSAAGATSSTPGNRPHLNVDLFVKNCVPLLRLCIDAQEIYEVTCLETVVNSIHEYYDLNTANELICGIFEILYDGEVIAKESFEKWYRQRQQQDIENLKVAATATKSTYVYLNKAKKPLSDHLQGYMQKLL